MKTKTKLIFRETETAANENSNYDWKGCKVKEGKVKTNIKSKSKWHILNTFVNDATIYINISLKS